MYMRHLFRSLLLALLICSPSLAQLQPPTTAPAARRGGRGPAGPPIKVDADHGDWNYRTGEPVKFSVTAPAGTAITYPIGLEMMPAESKTAVIPESGTLVLDGGTLKEPGFLRCIVTTQG